MKIVWVLLIKDWRSFWGDKVAVGLTFMIPFFIIFLMGNIFGISPKSGNSGGGGPSGIPLGIVDQTDSKMVRAMVEAIDEDKAFRTIRKRKTDTGEEVALTEEDVRSGIQDNQYRYALVFPEDAFGNTFGFKVKLLQNPRNQIETQTTEGLIQKNLMMAYFENIWDLPILKTDPEVVESFVGPMSELVSEIFEVPEEEVRSVFKEDSLVPDFQKIMGNWDQEVAGEEESDEESSSNLLGEMMDISKERIVGKEIKNPQGILIVAGYSVMFLLFTLNGVSSSLFEEKQAGIFLRLLSSPVSRAHILWSKYLFGIAMGMLQMLTMFLASWVIFRVEIFYNFPNLVAAMFFVSVTCTALGMLICSISKTQAQANGIGTLVIISMSAVGGAWFPVSFMPAIIQSVSKLTVVYWSVEALLRTAFEGKMIFELFTILGALLLMTGIFISFSLWRFKKGDLF